MTMSDFCPCHRKISGARTCVVGSFCPHCQKISRQITEGLHFSVTYGKLQAMLNEALGEWYAWMSDADEGDFVRPCDNDWDKYHKIKGELETAQVGALKVGAMTDYIRKAVELADGFRWLHRDQVEIPDLNNAVLRPFEQQWFLDALAAQLVRQVDAVLPQQDWLTLSRPFYKTNGPDRTMNTIKAIVDSGVLDD